MAKALIEKWPGGVTTVSGGTRVAVRLDRPWQARIMPDPAQCPFELSRIEKERKIVDHSPEGSGWRLIDNRFSPFSFHQMIVPTTCWEDEKVRILGGREEMEIALGLADKIIRNCGIRHLNLDVNVGASAGQNQPHQHYHVYSPQWQHMSNDSIELLRRRKYLLASKMGLEAYVGGHRAGQCYILPSRGAESDFVPGLAEMLHCLINLYADRFRSAQGMPPDYSFSFVFRNGKLKFGNYVPILNHLGAINYSALMGEGCVALPWPHKVTLAHLCGEQLS